MTNFNNMNVSENYRRGRFGDGRKLDDMSDSEQKQWLKKTMIGMMNTFGESVIQTEDNTNCNVCGNKGYVMEIIYKNGFPYEVVHDCKCMPQRRTEKTLAKSGLDIMLTKTFDSYIARDVTQRKVKELAQKNIYEKKWFFIGGQSGFGKTHICSALANNLLKLGKQVKYSIWTKDFKELNYLQIDNQIEFRKKKRELETIENLYIDDLFKNRNNNTKDITNADVQLMFDVINYRYNNNLKTIISSEFNLDELYKVDQAIAGRIKEKCGEFVINITKDIKNNYRLNNETVELEDLPSKKIK